MLAILSHVSCHSLSISPRQRATPNLLYQLVCFINPSERSGLGYTNQFSLIVTAKFYFLQCWSEPLPSVPDLPPPPGGDLQSPPPPITVFLWLFSWYFSWYLGYLVFFLNVMFHYICQLLYNKFIFLHFPCIFFNVTILLRYKSLT